MPSDDLLYGIKRQRRMNGEKDILTNTGLSFASQLGSLINSKDDGRQAANRSSKGRAQKEDIFKAHVRNATTNKKARREADAQQPFGQRHTIDGEGVESTIWNKSKRKMEEKARMYSAMKRGDIEDEDEKYAVDFDRKWTEGHDIGSAGDHTSDEDDEPAGLEMIEYLDEFGRTRKGTREDAARAQRQQKGQADLDSDRFTARPTAPTNIIYGDTIQHQAFNPDAHIEAQMEAIAKKRDRSLTPPPDMHFDAAQEIRQKGTGFFAFSGDTDKRKKQMENLEEERMTTERKRKEREEQLRREVLERDREFREDDEQARRKRKADDFLNGLGDELRQKQDHGMDAMQKIEAALARDADDTCEL